MRSAAEQYFVVQHGIVISLRSVVFGPFVYNVYQQGSDYTTSFYSVTFPCLQLQIESLDCHGGHLGLAFILEVNITPTNHR